MQGERIQDVTIRHIILASMIALPISGPVGCRSCQETGRPDGAPPVPTDDPPPPPIMRAIRKGTANAT